jgi:hypothetical protein
MLQWWWGVFMCRWFIRACNYMQCLSANTCFISPFVQFLFTSYHMAHTFHFKYARAREFHCYSMCVELSIYLCSLLVFYLILPSHCRCYVIVHFIPFLVYFTTYYSIHVRLWLV